MNRIKVFVSMVSGAILTLAVGAVIYAVVTYIESLKPNYLSFTYLQPVRQEPPLFHLDEPIQVSALFYNSSSEPIDFTALVFWTRGNRTILQFSFQQTLQPGCTQLSFDNNPPDEVKQVTQELFNQGEKMVAWRIQGHNAVIRPYSGGLQPFQVEEATYIPNDVPLPDRKIEAKLAC